MVNHEEEAEKWKFSGFFLVLRRVGGHLVQSVLIPSRWCCTGGPERGMEQRKGLRLVAFLVPVIVHQLDMQLLGHRCVHILSKESTGDPEDTANFSVCMLSGNNLNANKAGLHISSRKALARVRSHFADFILLLILTSFSGICLIFGADKLFRAAFISLACFVPHQNAFRSA